MYLPMDFFTPMLRLLVLRGGCGQDVEMRDQQENLAKLIQDVRRNCDAAWGECEGPDGTEHPTPSVVDLYALLERVSKASFPARKEHTWEGRDDDGEGIKSKSQAMDMLMDSLAGLGMRGLARAADGERFLELCLAASGTRAEPFNNLMLLELAEVQSHERQQRFLSPATALCAALPPKAASSTLAEPYSAGKRRPPHGREALRPGLARPLRLKTTRVRSGAQWRARCSLCAACGWRAPSRAARLGTCFFGRPR